MLRSLFIIIPILSFILYGCSNVSHTEAILQNVDAPKKTISLKEKNILNKVFFLLPTPSSKILDAPLVSQMPELPRGCEVTSLAMLLQYNGVDIDKMTLSKKIKKVPFQKNGLRGNPYNGFVGNMYSFSKPGLGVYHGPIYDLANTYLPNKVIDLTGNSFEEVIKQISQGNTVWVINTSTFNTVPNELWYRWETKDGPIDITYKEHSVLVTGYDEEYIYFNDPLANISNRKIAKEKFINGWNQIGQQAITIDLS